MKSCWNRKYSTRGVPNFHGLLALFKNSSRTHV